MKKADKYKGFNDSELYMLKRALIESSGEIALSGFYNDAEIKLSGRLLNEIVDEIKRRSKNVVR